MMRQLQAIIPRHRRSNLAHMVAVCTETLFVEVVNEHDSRIKESLSFGELSYQIRQWVDRSGLKGVISEETLQLLF